MIETCANDLDSELKSRKTPRRGTNDEVHLFVTRTWRVVRIDIIKLDQTNDQRNEQLRNFIDEAVTIQNYVNRINHVIKGLEMSDKWFSHEKSIYYTRPNLTGYLSFFLVMRAKVIQFVLRTMQLYWNMLLYYSYNKYRVNCKSLILRKKKCI